MQAKKLCPAKEVDLLYQINYSLGKVYYYKVDWQKARSSFLEAIEKLRKSSAENKLEEECSLHNNIVSSLLLLKQLGTMMKTTPVGILPLLKVLVS